MFHLWLGGGINNIKIIEKLLRSGADKVSINTAAVLNPSILSEASQEFGSQCIVGSLDYKISDNHKVFINCGLKKTEKDIFEMSKIFEQSGCGEIIISSIDNDGMQIGYDIDTISKIKKKLKLQSLVLEDVDHMKICLNYLSLLISRQLLLLQYFIFLK